MKTFHGFVSVVFHPTITLIIGLALVVLYSFDSLETAIGWFFLLLGVCFGPTGIYYVYLLSQKKISPDVKKDKYRIQLLKIAVLGLSASVCLVFLVLDNAMLAQFLLAGMVINLLYLIVLTLASFEVSVHVGILTILVLFLIIYISPLFALPGLFSIMVTGWSRLSLKMHTPAEIFIAFGLSAGSYLFILMF